MASNWLEDAEGFNTILDIGRAYVKTEVLTAAINLGVFETLESADDYMSARHIAEKNELDKDGTEAIMNVCVGLKLLAWKQTESGESVYSNTPITRQWLLKRSPKSMLPFLCAESDDVVNLEESIRTGKCQWYGKQREEETLDYNEVMNVKSDCEKESFWNLMHMMSTSEASYTSTAFDLSSFKTICDLGGCTGAFLKSVEQKYSNSEVILFDLPAVIEKAPTYIKNDTSRIKLISGDFFKDALPKADLYVLSRILHDWNKKVDLVHNLLTKIFNSLPQGGGLLIIEYLVDENRSGPMRTLLQSVLMTCMQEGKEMTSSEYTRLLEGVGFRDVKVKSSPFVGVLLAYKP